MHREIEERERSWQPTSKYYHSATVSVASYNSRTTWYSRASPGSRGTKRRQESATHVIRFRRKVFLGRCREWSHRIVSRYGMWIQCNVPASEGPEREYVGNQQFLFTNTRPQLFSNIMGKAKMKIYSQKQGIWYFGRILGHRLLEIKTIHSKYFTRNISGVQNTKNTVVFEKKNVITFTLSDS